MSFLVVFLLFGELLIRLLEIVQFSLQRSIYMLQILIFAFLNFLEVRVLSSNPFILREEPFHLLLQINQCVLQINVIVNMRLSALEVVLTTFLLLFPFLSLLLRRHNKYN